MTNEEIRIKVAEACGWTDIRYIGRGDDTICIGKPAIRPGGIHVPDYPLDLNACAEFEATLIDKEWDRYTIFLLEDCGGSQSKADRDKDPIHAKAHQRCIAFLKTKELIP